jgi:two-component system nitrogen regulation response regulator GlnG
LLRQHGMSARPGAESFDELVTATLPSLVSEADGGRLYRSVMARVELPLLRHTLELCGGNQLKAAKLLGINRNTLRKRLRLLGLLPVAGTNGAKAGARSA